MAKSEFIDLKQFESLVSEHSGALKELSPSQVKYRVKKISDFCKESWRQYLKDHLNLDIADHCVLGSYGRAEGSLFSDLDLLILNPEEVDSSWQTIKSLRLRSIDELKEDGPIDPFYLASIIHYMNAIEDTKIKEFIDLSDDVTESLIKSLQEDHNRRLDRFDNISNYLEPNLKFQPGGIRDLDQALCLCYLAKQVYGIDTPFLVPLEDLKKRMSFIRQVLHSRVSSDVLIASHQEFLANYFCFPDIRSFMSYVSALCEESAFLCRMCFASFEDWPCEDLSISDVLNSEYSHEIGSDYWLRYQIRDWISRALIDREDFVRSSFFASLQDRIKKNMVDEINFLFDSRILDLINEDFSRVRNLVQHDQYHRYTVGGHTLTCLRKTSDLFNQKLKIGRFQELLPKLRASDRAILYYTSLYHDLGKGLEGDHSEIGQRIVEKNIANFTSSQKIKEEVKWMVKNHLLFSKAAFRTNLEENSIFKRLQQEDLNPRRIRNLFLFTVIDIASSNPDALSVWKLDLLFQLYLKLSDPQYRVDEKYRHSLSQGAEALDQELIDSLDFDLCAYFESLDSLKSEVASIKEFPGERFLVDELGKSHYLIRYSRTGDSPLILFRVLSFLNSLGLVILKVNANTWKNQVYDIFLVSDERKLSQIKNLLTQFSGFKENFQFSYPKQGKWNQLQGSWIIRAEGNRLAPLLLGLTGALALNQLNIEWINIYRWGRQFEVVLALSKNMEPKSEWLDKTWSF